MLKPEAINLLATLLFAWLTLWIALGALLAATYPLFDKALNRIDAAQRAPLLALLLALPLGGSFTITALLYLPQVRVSPHLVELHCQGGNCTEHVPVCTWAVFPAALLLLWCGSRITQLLWRTLARARRLSRQLPRMSQQREGYYELDNPAPTAFTLGWLWPRIFLSSGLLQQCRPRDIEFILAHERAHCRRKDNLQQLLLRLLGVPLPRILNARLFSDYRLACEQLCDRIACGNAAAQLAETLLRVARLQHRFVPPGSQAFINEHTEQRIAALLADDSVRLYPAQLFALASVPVIFTLLLVDPVHYLLDLL